MSKKGKIIVLVSPSGGGKSTMTKRLLEDFEVIKFSVSATTRPPRKGEKDGVHYHFFTKEEFEDHIDRNEFLEWEEFYNRTMYGTLRSDVEKELKKGYFILLDIDVLGAKSVKEIYGDGALAIFLKPPSIDILTKRLINRGTETEETLKTRIDRAKKEMAFAQQFDTIVVNDEIEQAYSQIKETVSNFINS